MMKLKLIDGIKLFFLSIFLITSINGFTQDFFSGKITYDISFQNPDNHENASYLETEKQVDSIVYYIADGSYKSETFFKGEITEAYVYNKKDNWVHYLFPDKEYYLSIDATTEKMNQKLKFEWLNEEKMILQQLSLKAKVTQGFQNEEIFYADQIRVNPEDFKDHNYAHWHKILKHTNGRIPLKNLFYDTNFIEVKEAINIQQIEFEDSFFEPDPKLKKVVYREILDQEAELQPLNTSAEKCYKKKVNKIEGKLIVGKNDNYVVQVVVNEKGEPVLAKSVTKNEAFFNVAEDIILNCGFEFEPATYQHKKVKSELYIPIQL